MTARDPGFIAALRARVHGEVRDGEALSRWSTYRIGGPATVLHPAGAEDVAHALRVAGEHHVAWFALGLGSNLLFPDDGLTALVIRLGKGIDALVQDGARWTIGAGMPQPLAAKRTAAAGFGGIHKMVGVPGSVGGGIVMNAGCHGAEWRDTVQSVAVIDEIGNDRVVPAADARFTYRRSALGRVVVVSATVDLHPEDAATLESETEELYQWRKTMTPFNQPCCGSVFKNPALPAEHDPASPRTAGQFIEAAGLKGMRVGPVEISPMHANYFVNTGGGTAADVKQLMVLAQRKVADQFGVALEPEVKLVTSEGLIG
ncbi:MAG TPA: UDP-N-acetylmuramate dehydrogenase [Gemmatimonadales bacterium]